MLKLTIDIMFPRSMLRKKKGEQKDLTNTSPMKNYDSNYKTTIEKTAFELK